MVDFLRMEAGCAIILIFVAANYFFTQRTVTKKHMVFAHLMVVSILNIFFDAITIYTVNNRELIPPVLNRILHIIFILSIGFVLTFMFNYVIALAEESSGKKIGHRYIWYLPLALAAPFVVFFPFQYNDTLEGSYSIGIPVYVIYFMVGVNLFLSYHVLLKYWKNIEQKKRVVLIYAITFEAMVCIFQIFFPTSLISAIGVTLLNLALYLTIENPNAMLIEQLKFEKERANADNQAKSTFIAHVSHEVRTPINAVIGMDEMILRETKDDKIRQYALDISHAADTLHSIINDVLDMSKMESGKLEIIPEKYDLSKLVRETVNMIRLRAEAKKLDVHVYVNPKLPSVLYGDDTRIHQILVNLLSNAVKYTHEGYISLKIDGKPRGDMMQLSFEVRDTGIGIKEEDLAKIYVAFERIEERRNRNIEGTGLGMSITAQLLKLMGSDLRVESIYGEGTRFYFELSQRIISNVPVTSIWDKEESKTDYSQNIFTAPDAKILLVDDNEMNRKVFVNLLNRTKVQIKDVDSGKRCLEEIQREEYNIIFLDHMMPDMDGIETYHRMQDLGENKSYAAKVIMLTANAMNGVEKQYQTEGFDGYLSKPIMSDELEQIILSNLPVDLIHVVKGEETKKEQDRKPDMAVVVEQTPQIDWEEAKKHLPTDELLFQTIHDFVLTIDAEANKLYKWYKNLEDADNLDQYRIKVHSLKSTAAMIGAMQLSEHAKELEMAARNQELQVIRDKTGAFLEELKELKSILTAFGSQKPKTGEKSFDLEDIKALLGILQLSMEEMDVDTADETMEQISTYTFPDKIRGEIQELQQSVLNLDPEQVTMLVQAIAGEL